MSEIEIPTALRPELTPAQRRRLFRHGIELFNAGRFYDAHEAWEAIWRSTTPEPRDLFQGLIQLAVGLYHYLERDKPGPASRVLARGRRRLEGLGVASREVDLDQLIAAARRWETWLATAEGEPPPVPTIEPRDRGRVD